MLFPMIYIFQLINTIFHSIHGFYIVWYSFKEEMKFHFASVFNIDETRALGLLNHTKISIKIQRNFPKDISQ